MKSLAWRALATALVLAIAGFYLLRGGIADGIVSRGDTFLQAGETSEALIFYRRALAFTPTHAAASARYATVRCRAHRSPEALADGIVIASRALAVHPEDASLHAARAGCLAFANRPVQAYADWAFAASATSDPNWDKRYLVWAAETAKRAGDTADAARWHEAAMKALGIK